MNQAKQSVRECTLSDLRDFENNHSEFTLVDVREDHEWAKGSIPGSIHLSKGIIERDIEKALPNPSALIVLYCGGGFRSILAAESIQKMGYSQVFSLEGGWSAWSESNS